MEVCERHYRPNPSFRIWQQEYIDRNSYIFVCIVYKKKIKLSNVRLFLVSYELKVRTFHLAYQWKNPKTHLYANLRMQQGSNKLNQFFAFALQKESS
jgi:hypothetical protein